MSSEVMADDICLCVVVMGEEKNVCGDKTMDGRERRGRRANRYKKRETTVCLSKKVYLYSIPEWRGKVKRSEESKEAASSRYGVAGRTFPMAFGWPLISLLS